MTLSWHELQFPNALTSDLVLGFTRMLAMRPRHGFLQQAEPLVCEVLSTPAGIRWSIGFSKRETTSLLPQLRGALPGLRVEPLEDRPLPAVERAVELRLSTNRRPLRTDTSDQLARTLLTALHQVHREEVLVLSWLVGPWLPRARWSSTRAWPVGRSASRSCASVIRSIGRAPRRSSRSTPSRCWAW